jgi:four helix bundle protein
MPGVSKFTDLRFWQRARAWSKEIFWLTKEAPFSSDVRLTRQINDSSESVIANIAEGFGRGTQGEFIQFLGYSIGSLNETQAHLCAAFDREYLPKQQFGNLFQEGTEIRKMMVAFVKAMNKPGSGVKHIRKTQSWTEQIWEQWETITGMERPDWVDTREKPAALKNNSKEGL